ncbi:auxin-responsive protein SAUR32-like [Canna indica]|uniref:Auxin-responsive protein SAUR32-like n=1 Tax=Canna indica TaxID=4628 RepID=A0AAQ3K3U3_9LILI|nr:auxin-responsive protein SAUR32-like [Canna indica]
MEESRKKRKKMKKGCLAVRVGFQGEEDSGLRRFVIPISYLKHPLFVRLLESAREVYGFRSAPGPLKLPCSVDDFLHLRWLIERESNAFHCLPLFSKFSIRNSRRRYV